MKISNITSIAAAAAVWLAALPLNAAAAPQGISDDVVRFGAVMDLEGDSAGLGQGMKAGLEAAFAGAKIGRRAVELSVRNDFYNPKTTAQQTEALIGEGIFAMIGNVGTPTAAASLPLLAGSSVPAVGFFTGAGLLRPGQGDIINFRASYQQETAAVIDAALAAGVKTDEVCAFVQDDGYGMAGVAGIVSALERAGADAASVQRLRDIIAVGSGGGRNHVGPVGVYTRNTLKVKDGYRSLKRWEETSGASCRVVVTVGTYAVVGRFIAYSRMKSEPWLFSAVSFTGADNLGRLLGEYGVANGVIVTQVVPRLDSELPIVADARAALGKRLDYVSMEGYIVGRMALELLGRVEGELSPQSFAAAAAGATLDLGGMTLDFSDDNQGSDLVSLTYLADGDYRVVVPAELISLFNS